MKAIRYRVNPAVPTQIAMKLYYGPGEKDDNRWLDLSRGLYVTDDDISHWTRLVTVMGSPGDTDSVVVVRMMDGDAEVIRHG